MRRENRGKKEEEAVMAGEKKEERKGEGKRSEPK